MPDSSTHAFYCCSSATLLKSACFFPPYPPSSDEAAPEKENMAINHKESPLIVQRLESKAKRRGNVFEKKTIASYSFSKVLDLPRFLAMSIEFRLWSASSPAWEPPSLPPPPLGGSIWMSEEGVSNASEEAGVACSTSPAFIRDDEAALPEELDEEFPDNDDFFFCRKNKQIDKQTN